jgi:hypothetical protein
MSTRRLRNDVEAEEHGEQDVELLFRVIVRDINGGEIEGRNEKERSDRQQRYVRNTKTSMGSRYDGMR